MKTRNEIVSLVNHEIASAHLVEEHIEMAYRLGYIQGHNDKENELESESEPTDEGLRALADLGKSNLSRFLPRRPDDVPAPPDGWVYVGRGVDKKFVTPSEHIGTLAGSSGWCCGDMARCGNRIYQHYAIRWTAPTDIWHRFGLLAPSEGGGWIPHTPGDAMPCDGKMVVQVLFNLDDKSGLRPWEARVYPWNEGEPSIIGWRPALAEVRS
jgi:hypothetical protein